MRTLAAVLVGFLPLLFSQSPQFRAVTTRVAVDVSVMSGHSPVDGLQAGDFQVLDNGVSQVIEGVAASEVPLDVSLIVDVSGSTADELSADRRDVSTIATMLRPVDRLRVIGFASEVSEIEPATPGGPGHAPPVDRLQTAGLSSVYDGITAALVRRVDPGRRHLVVVYTDGVENRSIISGDRLLAIGQMSEAVLHLVTPNPVPVVNEVGGVCTPRLRASRSEPEWKLPHCSDDPVLEQIVVTTGGAVHFGTQIARSFQQIFHDFVKSYVIYFRPTGVSDTGWHDLQVRVPRGGYAVHARRGYFAGR